MTWLVFCFMVFGLIYFACFSQLVVFLCTLKGSWYELEFNCVSSYQKVLTHTLQLEVFVNFPPIPVEQTVLPTAIPLVKVAFHFHIFSVLIVLDLLLKNL